MHVVKFKTNVCIPHFNCFISHDAMKHTKLCGCLFWPSGPSSHSLVLAYNVINHYAAGISYIIIKLYFVGFSENGLGQISLLTSNVCVEKLCG